MHDAVCCVLCHHATHILALDFIQTLHVHHETCITLCPGTPVMATQAGTCVTFCALRFSTRSISLRAISFDSTDCAGLRVRGSLDGPYR